LATVIAGIIVVIAGIIVVIAGIIVVIAGMVVVIAGMVVVIAGMVVVIVGWSYWLHHGRIIYNRHRLSITTLLWVLCMSMRIANGYFMCHHRYITMRMRCWMNVTVIWNVRMWCSNRLGMTIVQCRIIYMSYSS